MTFRSVTTRAKLIAVIAWALWQVAVFWLTTPGPIRQRNAIVAATVRLVNNVGQSRAYGLIEAIRCLCLHHRLGIDDMHDLLKLAASVSGPEHRLTYPQIAERVRFNARMRAALR